MGRPRKHKPDIEANSRPQITTRDPLPTVRDPHRGISATETALQTRNPRRYIPANMPTVCPTCKANTRQDDGRHVDPVRQTVLEYRTCIKCGAKLAAGRPMTLSEKERLCSRADAVQEYEKAVASPTIG